MNCYFSTTEDINNLVKKFDEIDLTVDTHNRIQIVDDEIIIAMDLACFLENNGYQITGLVQDGQDAVALAIETRPDIIIMDIDLPGFLDGIGAAKKIQKEYQPKIIFASGHIDDDPRIRSMIKEGVNTFIRKPFSNDVIMKEINDLQS